MVLERSLEQTERVPEQSAADLFERHKDRIYSIALRYSGDPAAAQDITQETFLKLFASVGSFRGDSTFESWLFRLVVNACFDYRRKSRRLAPFVESVRNLLHAPGASALDHVLRDEMSVHLKTAIDSLPPEQRMAVVLRYTEGFSYDQIAEAMGCSAGTVASRLSRAHKILERRLCRLAGKGCNERG